MSLSFNDNSQYDMSLMELGARFSENEDKEIILKKYMGPAEVYVVPPYVVEIGDEAFSENKYIRKVIIPDTVEVFGESVFYSCKSLEHVVFSPSVINIPRLTFKFCQKLKKVEMSDSIVSIGNGAFSGCVSLEEIQLSANLRTISHYAFEGCQNLSAFSLPPSVRTIGMNAFADCEALKELKLPENLEQINSYAFKNCTALSEMTLSSSASFAGLNIFLNCSGLKNLNLPRVPGCGHLFRESEMRFCVDALFSAITTGTDMQVLKNNADFMELLKKRCMNVCEAAIKSGNTEFFRKLFSNGLISRQDTLKILNECNDAEIRSIILEYLNHNTEREDSLEL